MLDDAGDTVLTASIDAGVDTTDEGADDIGRLSQLTPEWKSPEPQHPMN